MTSSKKNKNNAENEETLIDVKLCKVIGLYQLLQPCQCDGFTKRYRTALLTAIWLAVGLLSMQIVRLYLELSNFQSFVNIAGVTIVEELCVFKGYVLVTNADRLWGLMDVAMYGFTSYGRHNLPELRNTREMLSRLLCWMVVGYYGVTTLWTSATWFMEEFNPFFKLDGTVGEYRQTIFNLWIPVSEDVFNWTPVWSVVYMIEMVIVYLYTFLWLMFDCYLLAVCIALKAQSHVISTAYRNLGHYSVVPLLTSSNFNNDNNTIMKTNIYNELITLIKDNQKLFKALDTFFDIITPVTFVHIAVMSFTMISSIFLAILLYIMDSSIISIAVQKQFFGYVMMTFSLFLYCYILDSLETSKASIIFAMYCCNWTEMELKFKKTLLLAMRMNSAHKRIIKMSPNSIVNMEMFTKLVKMSYTVVSVLLNVKGEKTENI